MGEQEINDKPRQRFTRCPPSQKPTDPRVRPRPSESQPERFLTTLKRPASFIPPKMRPSQERSARLSEPLLLAHLSPPVPFSSSSDAKYFAAAKGEKKSSEEAFFAQGEKAEKKKPSTSRAADQKSIDKALLSTIKKEPMLAAYLSSSFSLRKGDRPHEMAW